MKYRVKEGNTFVRQVKRAGLEPMHYRGRYFWEGPAVSVDDLQVGLSATRVPCQWDSLGLGYVVYPRTKCGPMIDGTPEKDDE